MNDHINLQKLEIFQRSLYKKALKLSVTKCYDLWGNRHNTVTYNY